MALSFTHSGHMTYDHWKTTNPADEWSGPEPEPEEEETEWEFFSGPFVSLDICIMAVRVFNDISPHWKYGVFPDPNTTFKWIIKRTWQ